MRDQLVFLTLAYSQRNIYRTPISNYLKIYTRITTTLERGRSGSINFHSSLETHHDTPKRTDRETVLSIFKDSSRLTSIQAWIMEQISLHIYTNKQLLTHPHHSTLLHSPYLHFSPHSRTLQQTPCSQAPDSGWVQKAALCSVFPLSAM